MTENKKKSIARYFLVPGFILITPAVMFLLYKMGEALVAAIMQTLQKGEIGSICFMLGIAGLVLLFIGGCIWSVADGDFYDVGWG